MAALDDLTNAGLPVPSIYASETGAADKAYQAALQQLAQQQSQAAQHYGFNVSTDPNTGAIQDTRIDPTQQFSAVMNMLQSQGGAMHNLREQLSGQGLTGGGLRGLAGQRAALLKYQQQGQTANLGSQFAQQYGGLENQKAAAGATRDQGYNQAAMDAINFAISNGWFNQAAPAAAPQIASADPNAGAGGAPPSGGSEPSAPQDTSQALPPGYTNAFLGGPRKLAGPIVALPEEGMGGITNAFLGGPRPVGNITRLPEQTINGGVAPGPVRGRIGY